ncbi:MAG: PKD domain-containing protein, partial [Fimbriimonadaceae bacterium]|nr:PKD domain-containing protein [Chitinophagales bacterium]
FFIPAIFEGEYDIYAGKWGYITAASLDFGVTSTSSVDLYLSEGYYDDFILDFNWDDSEIGASTGNWEREEPVGTTFSIYMSNPEDDVTGDFGNKCYVTGNGGGAAGDDDVDDGTVILESPIFDLSDYDEPTISFYYWFFNDGGSGTPNDTLTISISNGSEISDLVKVDNSLFEEGEWLYFSGTISDYIDPSSTMQLNVRIADTPDGHICEGAIDKFEIKDTEITVVPVAAFIADNITGCEPYTIHFTDESDNSPSSWTWVFEGGSPATSPLENPTVEYTTPGTYDVTLTATNAVGSNTIVLNDYITIYDSPSLTTSAGAGTATVIISGGTAPFDIVWNDDAEQTTETATGLTIGIYTVTVTDANGCVATAEANVQTVSVENILAGFNYTMYPNPVNDILIIQVDENIYSAMQLIIEDISGRIIAEKNISYGENKISMLEFPAGIYSIKIFADNKIASLNKIVKQ